MEIKSDLHTKICMHTSVDQSFSFYPLGLVHHNAVELETPYVVFNSIVTHFPNSSLQNLCHEETPAFNFLKVKPGKSHMPSPP